MSDAPVCIICGIEPTTAFPSKNIFHPKNGCILSTTQRLFAFEQWQKLMARPEGEVVVTRDESGNIVAVTRQDDEGQILSVIAER